MEVSAAELKVGLMAVSVSSALRHDWPLTLQISQLGLLRKQLEQIPEPMFRTQVDVTQCQSYRIAAKLLPADWLLQPPVSVLGRTAL